MTTPTIELVPLSELEEMMADEKACELDDYFGLYDDVDPASLPPCPRPAAWAFRMRCCGSIELICQKHYDSIMSRPPTGIWCCKNCHTFSVGLGGIVGGTNKV